MVIHKLRDYQVEDRNLIALNFFALPGQEAWRQLGVWPTGCGKTVLASTLNQQPAISQWLERYPRDQRKILFIPHREELLTQARDKMLFYNPDLVVEIEQADSYASPEADVIVASIQTLASRSGKRLGRFDKDQVRIIIIDEAHHSPAPSYIDLLQYFGILPPDDFMPKQGKLGVHEALMWQRDRLANWDRTGRPDRLLVGITATAKRGDNIGLELVFQKIAFFRSLREMVKAGYLTRPRGIRIDSTANLDPVSTKGGDLDEIELAKAISTKERNRLIVKAFLEHAADRKTIAFTVNVEHSESLAEEFLLAGVTAAAVSGRLDRERRRQILQDFKRGKIQVLTNCNILVEGYDEPEVSCIIMGRPTKSSLLYVQMAGRGTRLFDGKTDCLIIDIADVTSKHSLQTAPTLVGLPAVYDVEGRDLVEEIEKIEELKAKTPLLDIEGARSMQDIDMRASEVDLFSATEAPEMTEYSEHAWLKTDAGQFEIAYEGAITGETLIIEQNPMGQWEIMLKEFNDTRPVMRPALDLEEAFEKADDWLKINRSAVVDKLQRQAVWRHVKPTGGQINLMRKLGIKVDTTHLTKGQAHDLIQLWKNKNPEAFQKRRPAAAR